MSESLPETPLPEHQPTAEPAAPTANAWYRRRVTKITAAVVAATGLVVGGIGAYAAASAPLESTDAIEAAFENLGEAPLAVTLTSADEPDSSFTLTHTDAGTQVSVEAPDASIDAVLNADEQRLYLRVETDEVTEAAKDPFVSGMLGGFTSVDALLNGDWVSVDVSEDSKALAALTEASPGSSDLDSEGLQAASDELSASVTSIITELKDPAVAAITDNATVTTVDDAPDADHYRVDLDVAGAQADLEDDLRSAGDDLVAAVEKFAAAAGDDVPGLTEGLPKLREQLDSGLDEGLKDDAATETIDMYVADEHFTKIVADDVTLTFGADPALEDVSGAVSMDDDLVRLLPMMTGLMAMGGDLES